jgi:hypothetical protein
MSSSCTSFKQRIQLAGNDNIFGIYGKNRKKKWLVLCCATYFHFYNLKILNYPPSSLSNKYRRTHRTHMLWSYHHAAKMITKSSSSATAVVSSEKWSRFTFSKHTIMVRTKTTKYQRRWCLPIQNFPISSIYYNSSGCIVAIIPHMYIIYQVAI